MRKLMYVGVLIAAAVFLTACNNEEMELRGYIFREDGIKKIIDKDPNDWNESVSKTVSTESKKNISFYLDAGMDSSIYASDDCKYYSIVGSIPEIIKTEFTNENNEYNYYKVVDYPYLIDDKYFDSQDEYWPDIIKEEPFYGSHQKIGAYIWNDHKPDWYDPKNPNHFYMKFPVSYAELIKFICNDYTNNKYSENLYIISSGFVCEGEEKNVLIDFCSSLYSNILYKNKDIIIGLIGFVSETNEQFDSSKAYFIMAIGAKEDVYALLNHIDEAQRSSFSESEDFFVIYINQQIDKKISSAAENSLKLEGDIKDFVSQNSYISEEINSDSYLTVLDTYILNCAVEGCIEIDLPYELNKTSSTDILWTASPSVEIVKGQYEYTGQMSEIVDTNGNPRTHISQEEYDFVYSMLGQMSPGDKKLKISSNISEYNKNFDQIIDCEESRQIISISSTRDNRGSFSLPFKINPESLQENIPYVINIEVDIASQINYEILDYKNYCEVIGCEAFVSQDKLNMDVINTWDRGWYPGIVSAINCLSGDSCDEEYEFVKSISFIIYKNNDNQSN